MNDALCRMTGFTREEVLGRPAGEYLDENSRQILRTQFEKRKRGVSESYEVELPLKKGGKIEVLISPRPVFDSEGKFEGSIAVITDITKVKQMEKHLRLREKELEAANRELREANSALNVLLKMRELDRERAETQIVFNVKNLVAPLLSKLKDSKGGSSAELRVLENYLDELTSPFGEKLTHAHQSLTSVEIQIADMIKHGKPTKEIAELLKVSARTVDVHRHRIRKKLGITKKGMNLRKYLASM
jgi:PAS domain S-box-containing protein